MKTLKTRHQLYLPDDLSETLAALAAKPGASKTAILTDAFRAWLERKAGHELDERFGPRLDRQHRIAQRSEATLNAIAEMLDLFLAHQLTLVGYQPPVTEDTGKQRLEHYRRFMDQVRRRLASNRGALRLAVSTAARVASPRSPTTPTP